MSPPPGRRIALRVDVDTHTGMRDGVPVLLDLFARARARASFFVTMGPDHSGRAIRRVFTRPGFAGKMARTGPLKTYGLYTVLSGTLLPSRPVGAGFPHLVRLVESSGHECGIHGWDHVLWHDGLERMRPVAIEAELRRAAAAFAEATGRAPAGTAAPAWRATEDSLAAQDDMSFRYASDCRGRSPFRPITSRGTHRTIQIPATLPTLDELIGLPGMDEAAILERLTRALVPEGLNVFTLHTEIEGRHHAPALLALLRRWSGEGWTFETLGETAERALRAEVPACPMTRGGVEGRAGWLSVQGGPPAPAAGRITP
ncbi:MAG TPA: polysaccharide deacetylase family protein [Patescibacteria group bacterium]|nr:polysaccharide deacetylase family protein [Patescibacteria group bacterium]